MKLTHLLLVLTILTTSCATTQPTNDPLDIDDPRVSKEYNPSKPTFLFTGNSLLALPVVLGLDILFAGTPLRRVKYILGKVVSDDQIGVPIKGVKVFLHDLKDVAVGVVRSNKRGIFGFKVPKGMEFFVVAKGQKYGPHKAGDKLLVKVN